MMNKQESDVRDLRQNQTKQMFHDQFDVDPKDDIDHMVMAKVDRDYNHEEYQTRTYLQQSLTFVVRS
jgi:hypothetical protein